MALSMDEQRMLAEIERRLAAEDPGLAARLSSFRRPGPAVKLRTPRGKLIGSLVTVVLVAVISLTVYAMIPFRAHGPKTTATPLASSGRAGTSAPAKIAAPTRGAAKTNASATTNTATNTARPKVAAKAVTPHTTSRTAARPRTNTHTTNTHTTSTASTAKKAAHAA